jgi:cell division protein FtsB
MNQMKFLKKNIIPLVLLIILLVVFFHHIHFTKNVNSVVAAQSDSISKLKIQIQNQQKIVEANKAEIFRLDSVINTQSHKKVIKKVYVKKTSCFTNVSSNKPLEYLSKRLSQKDSL